MIAALTKRPHRTKKFYPVIHCISPLQQQGIGHALANTKIALNNGADGVFLIGHSLFYIDLCTIYEHVRKQFTEAWIGVNFLDVSPKNKAALTDIVHSMENLSALWVDVLPKVRLSIDLKIQVFGGVAFKYIDSALTGKDLQAACEQALEFVDIVTTSGDKTGQAPTIQKLQEIHGHLDGLAPLAVASGVSEENISEMLPYVDTFLVASSITRKNPKLGVPEYLVPGKVRALAGLIHQK